MLKKKDRLKVTLFGIKAVSKKLQEALDVLKQAENDYIQLHSFDGDKASVKKDPILSTIEGKVKVERALDHIQTIERIMETEGAERDMDLIKVNRCKGEGQGSCKRCSEKGKGNRVWMCSLYEIEGREGCYCFDCVKELLKEEGI